MNSRKARYLCFLVCLSVLLSISWTAPALAASPNNPSGFTATVGPGGDVVLKWNPVPNAIYYNLQGPGVKSVSGKPPNVTGTTYTVKGLPAGTHSWVLFAVYSGPSGPYFGDESNPARASMTLSPQAARPTSGMSSGKTDTTTRPTSGMSSGKTDTTTRPTSGMSSGKTDTTTASPFQPKSATAAGLEMVGIRFQPKSATATGLEMVGTR